MQRHVSRSAQCPVFAFATRSPIVFEAAITATYDLWEVWRSLAMIAKLCSTPSFSVAAAFPPAGPPFSLLSPPSKPAIRLYFLTGNRV